MTFNISNYISSPFNAITSNINFLLFSRINTQIIQLIGVIDAIPEEIHHLSVGTSDYPIETGATLTDHAFIKPTQLTLTGYISDLLVENFSTLVTPFRDSEGWERILFQIQQRELVSVVTLLTTYNNMIITDVTTTKDNTTGRSLIFKMQLKQALIANTQLTKLPKNQVTGAATNKTGLLNGGSKQSVTGTNIQEESWLSQIVSNTPSFFEKIYKKSIGIIGI